ncbi:hypothetical protein E2562_016391 [Oryza meyeriana var. granulata]|uniref:Uncharacterized protein n=1 Tax=Oryza meyeriana var. granulata TaxID=110450 RepID=A0A6G1EX59_9ORYZ|nr:hypothetical protein E2562_016391 [Oryza meyeriana var. granulata]
MLFADADLLAVRLIVASRGMTAFSITSAVSAVAFEPALRLAVISGSSVRHGIGGRSLLGLYPAGRCRGRGGDPCPLVSMCHVAHCLPTGASLPECASHWPQRGCASLVGWGT